jgi:hypothetical protein
MGLKVPTDTNPKTSPESARMQTTFSTHPWEFWLRLEGMSAMPQTLFDADVSPHRTLETTLVSSQAITLNVRLILGALTLRCTGI